MCNPNFTPLDTDRVLLRPVEERDQPLVFKGLGDTELTRYMPIHYQSWDSSGAQMDYYRQQRISGQGFYWVMEDRQSSEEMGVIGLNKISAEHQRAELGFWILPAFQRKGFVRESALAVIRDAFLNQGFIRIEACAETENTASCNLLQSLGFRAEGVFRSYEWNRGNRIHLEWFGLLHTEWKDGSSSDENQHRKARQG